MLNFKAVHFHAYLYCVIAVSWLKITTCMSEKECETVGSAVYDHTSMLLHFEHIYLLKHMKHFCRALVV